MNEATVTCKCGAKLIIAGSSIDIAFRISEFNAAHEVCRKVAVAQFEPIEIPDNCLHKGLKPGDVHMIACPCPSCSPRC